MNLKNYQDTKPVFKLEEFFNGTIKGYGLIEDWKGKVTRRFDVTIIATWQGNNGTLDETFQYYDGDKQHRVWKIIKNSDGTYQGTAGDILGTAVGAVNGSAAQWKYQMDLTVKGSTVRITFDDWMYLMNDNVVINRSYLRKFGLTVAQLTLVMKKQ